MNAEYLDGWTAFAGYLMSDFGRYGRTYARTLVEGAISNAVERGVSDAPFYRGWEDAALASIGGEM